jgi:hypothetical protein
LPAANAEFAVTQYAFVAGLTPVELRKLACGVMCERLRDRLCAQWRALGQIPAAERLERDWEDFVSFYDFPRSTGSTLRTNAIEPIFAGVRLRTNLAKRMHVRENALYLTFKLILRLRAHGQDCAALDPTVDVSALHRHVTLHFGLPPALLVRRLNSPLGTCKILARPTTHG